MYPGDNGKQTNPIAYLLQQPHEYQFGKLCILIITEFPGKVKVDRKL